MIQIFYEAPFKITQGTLFSAGHDIRAAKDTALEPDTTTVVPTSIHVVIPQGYWLQIEGRSSLAIKGVFPIGGIIDNDYVGEIKVALVNLTRKWIHVKAGERIAQLVVRQQYDADFIEMDFDKCPRIQYMIEKKHLTRGTNGFGSTGK